MREASYELAPDQSDVGGHEGDEVRLELGYERPFVSAQTLGDDSTPLSLPIEYGLQGGHHVDISLRFTGLSDPDLVS